ncbi:MAG TPA: hypothetical protein VGO47_12410 [Chlamydiales bacterium]|jgi:hypothetical protein|nr:hypothetical protein [Chlamydiales bacterium]
MPTETIEFAPGRSTSRSLVEEFGEDPVHRAKLEKALEPSENH